MSRKFWRIWISGNLRFVGFEYINVMLISIKVSEILYTINWVSQ